MQGDVRPFSPQNTASQQISGSLPFPSWRTYVTPYHPRPSLSNGRQQDDPTFGLDTQRRFPVCSHPIGRKALSAQLTNLAFQLLSNSTQSNGNERLNQLHSAVEGTGECHFPGRNFQLPFRSNSYYVLHGVAPFFLSFFQISILLGATPISQRSLPLTPSKGK
jgi:hypothetical protein